MRLLQYARTLMASSAFGGVMLFAQTPAAKTIRVSAMGLDKQKVLSPLPQYPVVAREAGVQGVVVLQAEIGVSGGVNRVELQRGDDRLGEAAMDAVRRWTYRPYLLNGEPVAVETLLTFAFRLGGLEATGSPGSGTVSLLNPIRVSAGVIAAQLVDKVNPEYPPQARAAGVSGSVVLHAFISKTGEIEDLTVISGPELLRDAALQAVQQWRYRPYLLNGEPVEVDSIMTVNFTLSPQR